MPMFEEEWQRGSSLKAVAFVDLVDSVRLLAGYAGTIVPRWRALLAYMKDEVLPEHGGRLASHRGDAMVLVFDSVPQALAAVLACRHRLDDGNVACDAGIRMLVRCAIHRCEVLVDEIDAFGSGVNVAARLAAHGLPGDVLMTVEAYEQLHPALDLECTDLGDLWLKHLEQPVRAYRAGSAARDSVAAPDVDNEVLRPKVAVLPFEIHAPPPDCRALGELIADELICALSALPEVNVTTRLSARQLAQRRCGSAEAARVLAADYVVSGNCHVVAGRAVVHAELLDARRGEVIETWRIACPVAALASDESPLVREMLERLGPSIIRRQVELAQRCALPNLAGHTLLLAAITLMHRMSVADVQRAHDMLLHLCERWPRLAAPQAWMARWHVFNVLQGHSANPAQDRALAFERSARALDLDPQSSVALTVAGSARIGLAGDVQGAIDLYTDALAFNPNDSLAWMLLGTAHAFRGEGSPATDATDQGQRLSPLDPLHFLYDCLSASAALAADDAALALRLADRSLRANGQHLSSLRVKAIAEMLLERVEDAGATVRRWRHLDPTASVDGYLRSSPSAAYPIGRRFAALLGQAGLPQS